jgi:hypothetical protein
VGIAVSLILIAAGAILAWAVQSEPSGLDLDVVGAVLMIVGIIGFILTLLFWYDWGPGPGRGGWRRSRYVEDDTAYRRAPPRRREVVVEEDREVVGPGEPPP